ncbi:DJ-1/PfpI family protein, partial [Methylorubrum podarium]
MNHIKRTTDMAGISGLKIAILVTDGFEQVELTEPRKALDEAGADTSIVSPKDRQVRGWKFTEWGESDLTGWLWTGLIERISQDRRSRTCGEDRRRVR